MSNNRKKIKAYSFDDIIKEVLESEEGGVQKNNSRNSQIGKYYKVNFFELESITVECPFAHRWDLRQIHEMSSWGDQSCPECQTMARWIVSVNKIEEEEGDSSDVEKKEQNESRGPGVLPNDYFKRGLG